MTRHVVRTIISHLLGRRSHDDLRQPDRQRRPRLTLESMESRDVPSGSTLDSAATNGTVPTWTASPVTGYFTPTAIRQAYGINTISFNGITGDGTGQTIAIVDAYDDPNIVGDLQQFDSTFNSSSNELNARPATSILTVVGQTGGARPTAVDPTGGWEQEESLDVEWAHAVAPGANIELIEANDDSTTNGIPTNLLAAVSWARMQSQQISVVSMSWGYPEVSADTSYNSDFTTPSGHIGMTFVASAGDNGQNGLFPASSPNVVAVGGTTLDVDGSGNYSSEYVWNNGSTNQATWNATGGGLSYVEPRPAYQSAVNGAYTRSIPDVSFDADPNTGVYVYDSYSAEDPPSPTAPSSSTPWGNHIGGTSLSAPAWAGLVAITDQDRTSSQLGTLDGATETLPTLYQLPESDYHDITSGDNYPTYADGPPAYYAKPGYDYESGFGTPVANTIVPALTLVSQLDDRGWTQTAQGQISSLSAAGNGIAAADFPGYGVILYTPSTGWGLLNTQPGAPSGDANAIAVDANGDVAASFPSGVYEYIANAHKWQAEWGASTASLIGITSSGSIVANFTQSSTSPGAVAGLYELYNGIGWRYLGTATAATIAVDANGDIAASFTGYGVWEYNYSTNGWSQLSTSGSPASQVGITGNGTVVANFNQNWTDEHGNNFGPGMYEVPENSTTWSYLNAGVTSSFAVSANGDIVASVTSYGQSNGVYRYVPNPNGNVGSWTLFAPPAFASATVTTVAIDGDGDMFVQFQSATGVWYHT